MMIFDPKGMTVMGSRVAQGRLQEALDMAGSTFWKETASTRIKDYKEKKGRRSTAD
jgi:hypothetical protein